MTAGSAFRLPASKAKASPGVRLAPEPPEAVTWKVVLPRRINWRALIIDAAMGHRR